MTDQMRPLAITVCLLLAGCGPQRPETAPVRGRVTYLGQPVTAGKIIFYPAQGRPALGQIGPDGTYELTTFQPGDGALPGSHQVTIQATRTSGPAPRASFEEELRLGEPATETGWLVPPLYAERQSSPLTAEVGTSENTIDFDLTAEAQ